MVCFTTPGKSKPRPLIPIEPILKLAGGTTRVLEKEARRAATFPNCFGSGTKGGADMIAHAATAVLEARPNYVLLKWDAPNGYGNADREKIRERLRGQDLPLTASLFDSKSAHDTYLTSRVLGSDGKCKTVWIAVPNSLCQGDDEAAFHFENFVAPVISDINKGN
eukprot:Lithocolla_globosa_v1_NODE_2423_length_2012_cov_36.100153.p2 type:complete len:165 gc:universal NODE_2423_length_2012_cov_36.100153:502-996(+)